MQPYTYHVHLYSFDPVAAIATTLPGPYTLRLLADGETGPDGCGSYTLDPTLRARLPGTSTPGAGMGTIEFVTGAYGIVVTSLTTVGGTRVPATFTDSSGRLWSQGSGTLPWIERLFDAVGPQAIGLEILANRTALVYYYPMDTLLQTSDPSNLPCVMQLLVYVNSGVTSTFLISLHNATSRSITKVKKPT